MLNVYASRRNLLLATLQSDFDPWLRAIPGEAGLHLAAMTAPGIGASALAAATREIGVGIFDVRSNVQTASAPSCILFGFGRTEEPDIVEGLARLRRLLSSRKLRSPRGS